MKTSKEQLGMMYEHMKELFKNEYIDIYNLVRIYNRFSELYNLDLAFWVDWCEYWGDDSIYCFTHINEVWSVVFNRSVNWYDENSYKDAVNYLLELQDEATEIRNKIEKADY